MTRIFLFFVFILVAGCIESDESSSEPDIKPVDKETPGTGKEPNRVCDLANIQDKIVVYSNRSMHAAYCLNVANEYSCTLSRPFLSSCLALSASYKPEEIEVQLEHLISSGYLDFNTTD